MVLESQSKYTNMMSVQARATIFIENIYNLNESASGYMVRATPNPI